MKQYKISEKANKLISENEVLYYFSDDDTVSLILCSKDGGEILIRNWTEPNVLKFEGYYWLLFFLSGVYLFNLQRGLIRHSFMEVNEYYRRRTDQDLKKNKDLFLSI